MKIKVQCPGCEHENVKDVELENGVNKLVCSQCVSGIYIVIEDGKVKNIATRKEMEEAYNAYFNSSSIVKM